MKTLKHILAAVLVLSLIVSCGLLGGLSSNTGAATTTTGTTASTGINTGSALTSILGVLLNSGSIDLGNLTNLVNLGQILIGANSLTNATQSYTKQFASDLITGSRGKITSSNVDAVIAGLKNLAGTDTSALTKATTSAFSGKLVPVSTSDKSVQSSMSAINSILNVMK